MAITDAQQAKQIMMKKGGPVTQAGVKTSKLGIPLKSL